MKTSNKILIGTLLIFLILMVIYNLQIRAEYLTGSYLNPYHDFRKINISDFDEIEINAANMMDINIKRGDFAVMEKKDSEDTILFTKVGRRLIININVARKPEMPTSYKQEISKNGSGIINKTTVERHPIYRNNNLVITLPNLKLLKVGNVFLVDGKVLTNYNYDTESPFSSQRTVELANFTIDSLTIIEHARCSVHMVNNQIRSFWLSAGKKASLVAEGNNKIQTANLQLDAGTSVILGDIFIPHSTYHVADSASLQLSGATLKGLSKQQ